MLDAIVDLRVLNVVFRPDIKNSASHSMAYERFNPSRIILEQQFELRSCSGQTIAVNCDSVFIANLRFIKSK